MLPFRLIPFLAGLLVCLLAVVHPAMAQQTSITVVEERQAGVVLEFRAEWPTTLRQTVDSLGVSVFDDGVSAAAAHGWLTISEEVELPSLDAPAVRIITSDYDELALPITSRITEDLEAHLEQLERPAAFSGGIGRSRGVALASIAFQPVTYDRESGLLRRYRRVVVEVDYAPRGQARADQRAMSSRNPHLGVSRSVLADGGVVKFPILEEGIYRIDRAMLEQMATAAGVPFSGVDLSEVKLYGNGGEPLPAVAGDPRPADLIENPVIVRDDAIIFYARGPRGWHFDEEGGWRHYQNPFSSANYYFLKFGGDDGQRIQTSPFPSLASPRVLTETEGKLFVQPDEFMWARDGGSGLTWVSRRILPNGELSIFDGVQVPGLSSATVRYDAAVAIASNPRTAVRFFDGGTNVGRILAAHAIPTSAYPPVAAHSTGSFERQVQGGRLNLSMRLESGTNDPSAALIWIRAFYPQTLTATDGYIRFTSPAGATGNTEYRLSGFSQAPTVLEVRDGRAVRGLAVEPSGGGYRVQDALGEAPRDYVAFTAAGARSLSNAFEAWGAAPERVAAQNLHGTGGAPEFVIITPDEFQAAAERLAEHRRSQGLDVRVVDIQHIYNEFSGGVPDMRAVRDFLKFLYDHGPEAAPTLKYALLFGDGHFNFRNIIQEGAPPALENWIFPYQTQETFHPLNSFTSDDYFALLDDEEGAWPYPGTTPQAPPGGIVERVDIGIGRFTVQTAAEAEVVVDKIIRYDDPATYGAWRGRYTLLADDHLNGLAAQENDYDLHTQNADAVADLLDDEHPRLNINKIYAESYQREFLGGWRIPTAKADVLSALNDGTLVFNFTGHGNTEALMQEEVFTRADVARLTNRDRQSIFVTATCDFGRWDLQDRQSTAEELLLHENGGTAALFTTVRVVHTSRSIYSLNVGLNRELNRAMFQLDEQGRPRRLGDILRITKNTDAGLQGNNRKFNLLGDPTMRVGIPASEVSIDEVNEQPLAEGTAPLRALDRVTVRGSVVGLDGVRDPSFDGSVELTIFDAARRVPVQYHVNMPQPYYVVREDLIWRGTANVEEGAFEATFVVPKDISYRDEAGRISAYARTGERHALGFTPNVIVGGTAQNAIDDDEGPEIRLFLNDTTFVSGGMTTPDPLLIVKLFDESGINTVGAGVGHEMMLVFNDDERNVVDLSPYYESEPGSYQRGTVTYRIDRELAPGPNSLSVRAWDVLNNSNAERLDFYMGESADLALRNVFNYPNPTSGRTRFVFEHNQPPGTPAQVQVRIYTINGRPIRTIEAEEALPAGVLTGSTVQIPWDGRDDDFGVPASGVYLYKLRVEAETPGGDRQVSEHIDRIAIIR